MSMHPQFKRSKSNANLRGLRFASKARVTCFWKSGLWQRNATFSKVYSTPMLSLRTDKPMPETKKQLTTGKLVAVEGLDGSGKSTQVYLLKRWLELDGYKVFFTEWNSSALVKKATRKGKKR